MRPEHRVVDFEIDLTPIWPADDDRLEPIVLGGPIWFEFDEPAQPYLEDAADSGADRPAAVADFTWLDADRLELAGDESPPGPQPPQVAALFGSLAVHLLVLLGFLQIGATSSSVLAAVPVQLVIEEPPDAPDEMPPAPLAADANPQVEKTTEATPAAAPVVSPPPAAPPPPPPRKKPTAASQPPKPQPPKPQPEPKPQPIREPPPRPRDTPSPQPQPQPQPEARPQPQLTAQPQRTTQPQSESRPVATTRPAASTSVASRAVPSSASPNPGRSSYFEYLVSLTRPHFNMLPMSFLAGRRGRTMLSILVREDGFVERIAVKQGSGYPDIDEQIRQMVAAIGRFPPLPEGFQRPREELELNFVFPEALQQ